MSVTINAKSSIPLLTVEQVTAWEKEREAVRKAIADARAKEVELTRKLEAAAVFMDVASVLADESKAPDLAGESRTLVDAIVRVVLASSEPMSPKMIRNAIAHSADAALMSSENYLYTAIKRAADKELIYKGERGYEPGLLS